MKTLLRIAGSLVLALVLLGAGFYVWASAATSRSLSRVLDSHSVDLPTPWPLDAEEVAALGLSAEQAERLAVERAIERGGHLLRARYACIECHGENFGGGVMVDDPMIGRILGPNITSGRGGRTAGYTPADWNRIVRHGLLPDGRPATMPSEDFVLMSDQELSDIVTYIRAQPPVDNDVPPVRLGPLGKVLVATGRIRLSADLIEAHDAAHAPLPPPAAVSVEFGRHLAAVCTGCHGLDLAGGPIAGGDPSWPPARNLTPDATGLAGWSYDDFVVAMREAQRPDGTPIRAPMSLATPFAQNMTDVEMQALWTYLQSVPPVTR